MDLFSMDRRINYRELQGIAKKMNLPGNLKYNLLVEVIRARREGKEHVVEKILGEQKLERVRRKHEKLGSQESAYQHLRSMGIHPGFHNHFMPPHMNGCMTSTPNHSPTASHQNNMPMRAHQSTPNSQPWAGVTNICGTDVRTVLQMPCEIFQNLHKKASEEGQQRIQEAHKKNPPLSYYDWLKMMDHKRYTTYYPPNQHNYMQEVDPPRYENKDYLVDSEVITPSEDNKKPSFQVKDLLADNGMQNNYGQFNMSNNQFDWNQLPADLTPFAPDGFLPQVQTYLPSINQQFNQQWRNSYEAVPDSTYHPQYVDYSVQQEVPSSSANAVSPQTSDTISGTDDDLPKENNSETTNGSSSLTHNYSMSSGSTENDENYLSQLDYEEPSTSNVPDMSSPIIEDPAIDPLLSSPKKDDLDSSDNSFIMIDVTEEIVPHEQGTS